MGCYPGLRYVHKFGSNEAVGTSYEDIWMAGGVHTNLTAATLLEVASSSANDASPSGTGARTIRIEGVDANWAEVSEDVTLNGQTPVTTTTEFLHVNRVYILTAGSSATNEGDIYIADDVTDWTAGVPDTASAIEATIEDNHGQTQQAIYHIPAGYTAYITKGYVTAAAGKTVTFQFVLRTTSADPVERVLFEGTIKDAEFINDYVPYSAIPEQSIVFVRAKVDSTSAEVSAGFDLILVDHTEYPGIL